MLKEVPYVEGATVISKNIIYFKKDILNSTNENEDYVETVIKDVSKYSLEECIKCILKSNLDNIIFKVKYDSENNDLYIYSDDNINIDSWIESWYIRINCLYGNTDLISSAKMLLI